MHHDKKEVLPRMRGLWDKALINICGADPKFFQTKKHQPCIYCGGNDRARWTNKVSEDGDGGIICNQCGSGDGILWIQKMRGESFSECIDVLGEWLNLIPVEVVNKANKQASRAQRYKMGSQIDHEKVMEIMERTEVVESTPTTIYEGIYLDEGFSVGVAKDGSMIHAVPCSMVYEDGLGDEFCNLMFIDGDSNVRFAAGDYTRDSVAVIGYRQDDSYTYVVDNYIDGVRVHLATGGREVFVCFSCYNMEMVIHRDKSRKFRIVCRDSDGDILAVADDRSVEVVVPNDGKSFKTGIRKKVYKASDLIS